MKREDYRVDRCTLGALDCVIVDALPEGAKPHTFAIICHGYGASGQDLVDFAPHLITSSPIIRNSMTFVFPAAPIVLGAGLGGESRAWWPIDMLALEQSMASGEARIRRDEEPTELPTRNAEITELIEILCRENDLGVEHCVLGGFSQGAMLTTDVALSLDKHPLGQLIFSGTLLCERRWRAAASKLAGLEIFQSHGRQDPLLRFEEAEALRDLFVEGGANVEFHPFNGEHTVGASALAAAGKYLERRIQTLA